MSRRRALIGGRKPPVQLVKNGDFANGTISPFVSSNGSYVSAAYYNGICKCVQIQTSTEFYRSGISIYNSLSLDFSHKFYISALVNIPIESRAYLAFRNNMGVGSYKSTQVSTLNQFVRVNNIFNTITSGNGVGVFVDPSQFPVNTNYYIDNIMMVDLTATYGAGNEPTTVEQFRADYPDDYYPYNPA